MDGGLGKLRWGGTGTESRIDPQVSALLLEPTASLPFDLHAMADIRYDPKQKSATDLLDAQIRWQPPPSGAWRWTVRAGAFFPPFSLENQDIGWSSPWTLTYSALDSWIGEELRTIGGEASVSWRGDGDTVTFTGAVYGWNDPAGVVLADRGFDIGNRALGLFDHLRLPDIVATFEGERAPFYTPEFDEIDNAPGWYAGASWDHPGFGKIELWRYDNETDAAAERNDVYGWRTEFWTLGFSRSFGPFRLLAQGMIGSTAVNPDETGPFVTDFHAVYALVGWTEDPWRAAVRVEQFGTGGFFSEHGTAFTASLNYLPADWLRLTAEVVVVDSWRTQREFAGLSARDVETEPQIGLRLSF